MNKSKLQATGLLVGVFIAGAVVGGAATAVAEWSIAGDTKAPRMSYTDRLQRDLNLSAHQRALAEEFISRYNDSMHQVWEEVSPRYEVLRESVRADIMGILDEDQQIIYRAKIARSDSIRAERRRQDHEKGR